MQYDLLNSNLSAACETKLGEAGVGVGMRIGWWAKYSVGRAVAICPFGPFPARRGGGAGVGCVHDILALINHLSV